MGNKSRTKDDSRPALREDPDRTKANDTVEDTGQPRFPLSSELPPGASDDDTATHDSISAFPPVPFSSNHANISKDVDLTNPSLSSTILALKERHAVTISRTKKGVFTTLIFVLVAVPIVFTIRELTIVREPDDASTGLPSPTARTDMTETTPPSPPSVDPSPSNGAKIIEKKDVKETIRIHFLNLPEDASVHFNQQSVSAPITVPKSSTPQFIEIFKGKERLFSTSIIPSADRTIRLPTANRQKHGRVKPGGGDEPDSPPLDQTSTRRPGNLSSNPFPLKTNPFAVGE